MCAAGRRRRRKAAGGTCDTVRNLYDKNQMLELSSAAAGSRCVGVQENSS